VWSVIYIILWGRNVTVWNRSAPENISLKYTSIMLGFDI
jgi:hypothetical protein